MKKLVMVLASTALVAASSIKANELQPYPGELRGTITQVLKGGILVDGTFKSDEIDMGSNRVVIAGTFFLAAFDKEVFEGMGIDVKALPTGTYTYITVWRASRTIKAFRSSDE